jgi:hypothetical protein
MPGQCGERCIGELVVVGLTAMPPESTEHKKTL